VQDSGIKFSYDLTLKNFPDSCSVLALLKINGAKLELFVTDLTDFVHREKLHFLWGNLPGGNFSHIMHGDLAAVTIISVAEIFNDGHRDHTTMPFLIF